MTRRARNSAGSAPILVKLGYAVACIFLLYGIVIGYRNFSQSALMQKRDRMNIVLYGPKPVLVSVGLTDGVHYVIPFSHGDNVSVPGGYGRYRVGALGKLAHLEKDPELISRTFSSMISAYVDFSIAPKDTRIYADEPNAQPEFDAMTVMRHVFSSTYSFDGNVLDKMYIVYTLAKYRSQDFAVLKGTFKEDADGDIIFSEKRFLKKYRGFFYHQSLRDEAEEVKVSYVSYSSASTISRVLEGQGIRVVDLSEDARPDPSQSCVVTYARESISKSALYMAETFDCKSEQGPVEGADVLIELGSDLSEKWE